MIVYNRVKTEQANGQWLAWIHGLPLEAWGRSNSEAEAIWELTKKSALGSLTVIEELEELRPRFRTLEDKEYFLKIRKLLGDWP